MAVRLEFIATSFAAPDATRALDALAADDRLEVVSESPQVRVVATVGEIADADPVPTVVVLESSHRRETSAALAAGAGGVVLIEAIEACLAAGVLAVASGLVVVPAATRAAVRRPVFSAREKQILGLVVMGLTNAEIGRRLYLAESTIKSALLSIYAQLGVKSRKEAADMLLDPATGLGLGILALTAIAAPSDGYAGPSVR